MKKTFLITIFLCCIFILTACNASPSPSQTGPIKKSEFLLGTICEITLYDKTDEKIFSEAFSKVLEIEKKMTINNAETSEILKLNQAAGKESVKLSPETFLVLERGLYYSGLTEGAFDITIGPLIKLWNIGTDYAAVPDADKLNQAMNLVDYKKLHLDKKNLSAMLEQEGMKVDLGAIAKGFAADEVSKVLSKNGVKHAIINLGGNILTLGGNTNGNPWKIGVQNPFDTRGEFVGIMNLSSETIVSSGTYEKFFEENGKFYHHMLDTRTGYPADNGLNSVSIVTPKSIDGDGLSTSTFLLGLDKGMELIEKLDGVEAVFITNDKKVYVSSGLKNNFTITNGEFTEVK